MLPTEEEFEHFVSRVEPRLHRALVSALGPGAGREATFDALSWAWEHWDRVKDIDNAVAYLFKVGRSSRRRRKEGVVFQARAIEEPLYEPGLRPALSALTERQRLAVVLIHGYGWTLREVAELTDIGVSTVQTHLERGLQRLRSELEVIESD